MNGRMKTYPIREVVHSGPAITTISLSGAPSAAPGQFFLVWLPGVDEKPISVALQRDGTTTLVVCDVGPWSAAMMQAGPGDLIGLRGPFGRGFVSRNPSLVVGGGMGIAPLRHLCERLMQEGLEFDVALGARTGDRLLFAEDFAHFGTHFATDDGSWGHAGSVLDLVPQLLDVTSYDCIYACGPESMLVALKQMADHRSIPVQFALERYMKCGIGLCGQCCMDGSGVRVCVEGPVFDTASLSAITEFGMAPRGPDGQR